MTRFRGHEVSMVFHANPPDPAMPLATREELATYTRMLIALTDCLIFWSGPTIPGTFSLYSERLTSIDRQVEINIEGYPLKELQKSVAVEAVRRMKTLVRQSLYQSAFEVPFGNIDLVGDQYGTFGRISWGRADPTQPMRPGFHHTD